MRDVYGAKIEIDIEELSKLVSLGFSTQSGFTEYRELDREGVQKLIDELYDALDQLED